MVLDSLAIHLNNPHSLTEVSSCVTVLTGCHTNLQQRDQLQEACCLGGARCAAPVPGARSGNHQERLQPGGHQEACHEQQQVHQLHEEGQAVSGTGRQRQKRAG